jgi:photosystem II stability/assembly factor-like uncharacterized protein
MTNQDREETLGRLLTSMQGHSHTDASSACLDAESLAAWLENQLTPAERSVAESHAASCARCQAMLAAMARTATAAEASAPAEDRSRSWVFRFAPWMAALGAAAVVAVMVANLPRTEPPPELQATASEDAAPAAIDALKDAPVAVQEKKETAAPSAAARAPAAAPADQQRARADSAEGPRSARPQAPSALAKTTDARQMAAADAKAKQEKPAAPLARSEPGLAAVAPPAQGQATASPPLVTPVGERAPERSAFGAARSAAARDALAENVILAPVLIQSCEANVRWRIMGGTVVQHTADGGATWTTQDVKVEAALVAGSAPTASVCWLVGRQGTVFVTADGRTWQRVTSPPALDLIGVTATGADSATVTAADGRSFTTSDRGRTWR